MNTKELQFILQEGEGQFIEFKENLDKKFAQEAVAFANASGGKIFLGIDDKNQIVGIKTTNKLKSQIQDMLKNCDPAIAVNLESFKNILIAEIKEGNNKPYSCSNGFYMRMNANSQKMNRDQIIELSIKAGKIRFDEQVCSGFSFKDFDDEKFNYFLKLANISNNLNQKEILKNLKILSSDGMTNAGVLFFAKEPYKYIGNSRLRCVRFKGNRRVDIIDKKEVDKGIIGNIEFAIQYLNECVPVKYEIKGSKRKEYPQFSEEAYREAVVNAVIHRDYFENGEVAVEKLQDKLIINNPGGSLVSGKEFGTVSRLRNRLIADLLSRTIFMERIGTGIKRIRDKCLTNNNEVDFSFSKNNFFVKIKSEPVSEPVNEPVNEPINEIIDLIKSGKKINRKAIIERLRIPRATATRILSKLKNKNIIEYVGSDKMGYYVFKK